MGRIGFTEILLILVVIMLFFGVNRLPQIGKSLGEAIREFQKALKGSDSAADSEKKNEKPS